MISIFSTTPIAGIDLERPPERPMNVGTVVQGSDGHSYKLVTAATNLSSGASLTVAGNSASPGAGGFTAAFSASVGTPVWARKSSTAENGSPAPAAVAPTVTTQPSITGGTTTGSVLTLNEGAASGTPAPTGAIQWLRGTTAISGATGATYTLVSGDVGQAISARVTWTNSAGSVSATSNAITGQAPATVIDLGSEADYHWAGTTTGADADVTGLVVGGKLGGFTVAMTGTDPAVTKNADGSVRFGRTKYARKTNHSTTQWGGAWAVFKVRSSQVSTVASEVMQWLSLDQGKTDGSFFIAQINNSGVMYLNDAANQIAPVTLDAVETWGVEVDGDSGVGTAIAPDGSTHSFAVAPGVIIENNLTFGRMFGDLIQFDVGLRMPGQSFSLQMAPVWEQVSGKKLVAA